MRNLGRILCAIGIMMAILGASAFLRPALAQTEGHPRPITRAPGDYINLSTPVAYADIGLATAFLGQWVMGTTAGDSDTGVDDDVLTLFNGTAFLYRNKAGDEEQVGPGTMEVPPTLDPNTRAVTYTWVSEDELFAVTARYQLVRDVLRYAFTIVNRGPSTERVGFRICQNLRVTPNGGGATWTGTSAPPYAFPNVGVLPYTHQMFSGSAVPSEWSYRYVPNGEEPQPPDYRPYLQMRQALSAEASNDLAVKVSRPQHLYIGAAANLTGYGWDDVLAHTAWPIGTSYVDPAGVGDSAIGLYYPLTEMAPRVTRVIRGELALNWSQVRTLDTNAFAVTAPEWIGYRSGDNPATPEIEVDYNDPGEIEVRGFACNSAAIIGYNPRVTATIDLGPGLALAAGQLRTQVQDRVGSLQDVTFRWRVVPTGNVSGAIPVRVTAQFSPGSSISAKTVVNVAARTRHTYTAPSIPTFHLTGFPFEFGNPDPRVALGLGALVQCATYDTAAGRYRLTGTDTLTLTPGRGYWLNVSTETTAQLQGATPLDQRDGYPVELSRGWNLISNPYQYGIIWPLCMVLYQGDTYTLQEAVNKGVIRSELWSWDPLKGEYVLNNAGSLDELPPYQGFWCYCTENLLFIFQPNPSLATMNPAIPDARSARSRGEANNWRLQLHARLGTRSACAVTVGVHPEDTNGASAHDCMAPPMSPAGLEMAIPRNDWGRNAGAYATDLQAPGGVKSWPITVTCTVPHQRVNVRWPDLTGLPPKVPVVLVDDTTGQTISLRTTTGYSFDSGNGGTRRFTLTVGGTQARLRFTTVDVNGNLGRSNITISYGVTIAADVTARLRTPTGRLIRTLTNGRAAEGLAALRWDGRDQQRNLVPAGIYFCELDAVAADGQRVRSMVPIQVRNN